VRSFAVSGVIKELGADSRTVSVHHEEVSGYMPAMTIPFKVQEALDWRDCAQAIEFRFGCE
jgi:Cu/Ag efflux protein CusF